MFPLAWKAAQAAPTTTVRFTWEQGGGFAWASTGPLRPGAIFSAAQLMPGGPDRVAVLDQHNGMLSLSPASGRMPPPPGQLAVLTTGQVPLNSAAVSLTVDNTPLVATQAQPNLNIQFTIPAKYALAALDDVRPGEVLTDRAMSAAVWIDFSSVSSWLAVLNPDSTWSVRPA